MGKAPMRKTDLVIVILANCLLITGCSNTTTTNTKKAEIEKEAISETEAEINCSIYAKVITGCNLRTEPSSTSQVISIISEGTEVGLLGRTNEWVHIITNDMEGYIPSSFIDSDEIDKLPTEEVAISAFEEEAVEEVTEIATDDSLQMYAEDYSKYVAEKIFESDDRYFTFYTNMTATYDFTNGVGEHYHYNYVILSIQKESDQIVMNLLQTKDTASYDGKTIENSESDGRKGKKETYTYNIETNTLDSPYNYSYTFYGTTEEVEVETAAPELEMTQGEAKAILKKYLSTSNGQRDLKDALLSASKASDAKHINVASIEDKGKSHLETSFGAHDVYDFIIKGTFYAYDEYGKVIDNYSFDAKSYVNIESERSSVVVASIIK